MFRAVSNLTHAIYHTYLCRRWEVEWHKLFSLVQNKCFLPSWIWVQFKATSSIFPMPWVSSCLRFPLHCTLTRQSRDIRERFLRKSWLKKERIQTWPTLSQLYWSKSRAVLFFGLFCQKDQKWSLKVDMSKRIKLISVVRMLLNVFDWYLLTIGWKLREK